MMKNEILIVYPQDETTSFLQAIPDFLFEKHGEDRFIYHRLAPRILHHKECITLIEELPSSSIIIFLGHGRSDALLGALGDERISFIDSDNLQVFKGKMVFFLSCRSNELLFEQGIEGIGFGHLLTSSNELDDPINLQKYWYLKDDMGFPDSMAINEFKISLTKICKESLHELIQKKLNINELHVNLKIRFNHEIANLLLHTQQPLLVKNQVNLLVDAKNYMQFFPKCL